MKRIIERGALIFFIALIPFLLTGFIFPDFPGNPGETEQELLEDADVAEYQDKLFSEEVLHTLEISVYDQNSELVYNHSFESGEAANNDKELRKLLRKCDLLMMSNSSVLYILK